MSFANESNRKLGSVFILELDFGVFIEIQFKFKRLNFFSIQWLMLKVDKLL